MAYLALLIFQYATSSAYRMQVNIDSRKVAFQAPRVPVFFGSNKDPFTASKRSPRMQTIRPVVAFTSALCGNARIWAFPDDVCHSAVIRTENIISSGLPITQVACFMIALIR